MKVGVVGSGLVGSTAAYALVMRGVGREIVLVDNNAARAQAEADDIMHAVPFANPLQIRAGSYDALDGSRVVIIAAGVSQKPGETRLGLLERNAAVFRDVIPQVLKAAPEAVLVIATNPVDIMTHLAAHFAAEHGVASSRVLGSGTTLDTARFRSLLGRLLQVDAHHVHGYVVGEHGDSEVLTWSLVTIGGIPLGQFCALQGIAFDESIRSSIDEQVRRAAYHIISGKGSTYYGIGSALARIVEVIIGDQQAILTVCTPTEDIAGIASVTVALPHLVGGAGVKKSIPLALSDEEQADLTKSASIVLDAIRSIEL